MVVAWGLPGPGLEYMVAGSGREVCMVSALAQVSNTVVVPAACTAGARALEVCIAVVQETVACMALEVCIAVVQETVACMALAQVSNTVVVPAACTAGARALEVCIVLEQAAYKVPVQVVNRVVGLADYKDVGQGRVRANKRWVLV